MGELLQTAIPVTGADAELIWVSPEMIEEADISPWTELPIWLPDDEEYGGIHDGDVSAAHRAGLSCRPMIQTVTDTWTWLRTEGEPPRDPDSPPLGLDPIKEKVVLDRHLNQ
jgi:2'-hydroxyisoflavone reductase